MVLIERDMLQSFKVIIPAGLQLLVSKMPYNVPVL
jgi:hypothetical protein